MKRKFYIPILIVCLFTACSEQIPEPDINGGGDGEVLLNILPPRIATTDDQLTRSMVTEAMPADRPYGCMSMMPIPAKEKITVFK